MEHRERVPLLSGAGDFPFPFEILDGGWATGDVVGCAMEGVASEFYWARVGSEH